MRMTSSTCNNWRKLGTIIWITNFFHRGSMFLMIPLWIGPTSGILDVCVSDVSRIPLAMSSITFVALSPPFCGEHILWRASTGQLNSVQRNGKSWGILMGSYHECVSQYLQLVSVLCLIVDVVRQILSQPCMSLVSTLLRSSRSANNGTRVYWDMPLANTPLKKMLLMQICWRP